MPPRLFLNHDAEYGWLIALEFGLTDDGQPSENWAPVGEEIAYLVDGKRCVGFVVKNLEEFDPHDPDHEAIWQEPTFDVPALGLRGVTAGEIIVATNVFLDGESTVNRYLFDAAINAQRKPRKAVAIWRQCLQTGDVMAHYGLGYTLYELGNYHEAYAHLRAYTEITPSNAWPGAGSARPPRRSARPPRRRGHIAAPFSWRRMVTMRQTRPNCSSS